MKELNITQVFEQPQNDQLKVKEGFKDRCGDVKNVIKTIFDKAEEASKLTAPQRNNRRLIKNGFVMIPIIFFLSFFVHYMVELFNVCHFSGYHEYDLMFDENSYLPSLKKIIHKACRVL